MHSDPGHRGNCQSGADLVRIRQCVWRDNIGQPFMKWAIVLESVTGATKTGGAGLDGIG